MLVDVSADTATVTVTGSCDDDGGGGSGGAIDFCKLVTLVVATGAGTAGRGRPLGPCRTEWSAAPAGPGHLEELLHLIHGQVGGQVQTALSDELHDPRRQLRALVCAVVSRVRQDHDAGVVRLVVVTYTHKHMLEGIAMCVCMYVCMHALIENL